MEEDDEELDEDEMGEVRHYWNELGRNAEFAVWLFDLDFRAQPSVTISVK